MTGKPGLTFYTNIPTPYQQSFFSELSKLFTLKVVYYTISESNREWKFDLKQAYEVIVLEDNFIARFIQRWVFDYHFSWKIFSIAWKDKNEFVIVGGSYATANATAALLLNRLKKKKIAYFSESLFITTNIVKRWIKWTYLRILNICCDAVFCVGKKAAESFEAYQVTPAKFIILYNIDEKLFQDLDLSKLSEYKNTYKSNNELVILSSGSLINRKGMDILIKAVKEINSPNIKLVIIGGGPQKKELLSLRGNDERIVFAGFQNPEELTYYFAIADIFAFASRYDGWAVVINEAIAATVPIVSSNAVGASVELITSDDFGILCESEDVASFRQAIELLIYNEDKRAYIKANLARLIPEISSSKAAEKVQDIFLNRLN